VPNLRLTLLALVLSTTGCVGWHKNVVGTRVHRFTVGNVNFVHCSILVDQAHPQTVHDSIEVCRDEIVAPVPLKK
jgi:hypothetical protein